MNRHFLKAPLVSLIRIWQQNTSVLLYFLLGGVSVGATYSQNLPNIVPTQPEVANFLRYGEIPVDFSTGVPKIEVPIYTVKSRKLEVPLTLSYHASGIKVNDLPSIVGLGWVLNSGGLIARTVLDVRDEKEGRATYKTSAEFETARQNWMQQGGFQSPSGIDNLYAIGNILEQDNGSGYDSQSDRFFYQLPGGTSGVFRYDFLTNEVFKIPYKPVVINKVMDQITARKIKGFDIVDENGNKHFFHVSEYFNWPQYESPDSWYLSHIISADNSDTIRFTYKAFRNGYGHVNNNITLTWDVKEQQEKCGFGYFGYGVSELPPAHPSSQSAFIERQGGIPLLDSIISAQAIVTFEYSNDRQDGPPYRMSKINVYDKVSGERKIAVDLVHSYFGTASAKNQRLKLEAVVFNPGTDQQKYSFGYHPAVLPPYAYRFAPLQFNEDYWGYNNVASNSQWANFPYQLMRQNEASVYIGSREPETLDYYVQACSLNKIVYPTGGITEFEFERGRVDNVYGKSATSSELIPIGGLRVKTIKSYSLTGKLAFQNTYIYGPPAVPPFYLQPQQFQIDFAAFSQTSHSSSQGASTSWDYDGYLFTPIKTTLSRPLHPVNVKYMNVTEYKGTESVNAGKTEFQYHYVSDDPISEGQPSDYDFPQFVSAFQWDRGNEPLRLFRKTIFRNDFGAYKRVREELNDYTPFRSSNVHHTGIHVVKLWGYPVSFTPDFYASPAGGASGLIHCDEFIRYHGYLDSYKYFDTKGYEEVHLLTNTSVQEYNDQGNPTISTSTSYLYENLAHLQPTQKTFVNSSEETIVTKFKYPQDFNLTEPYTTMVTRNILSPVIEQTQLKNGSLVEAVKTNYAFQNNGNDIIEPATVNVQHGSNPAEIRLRFSEYDSYGNVTMVSKEKDLKISYIYDANRSRPIAEVKNVINTVSIFHTSFEDDGNYTSMSYTGSKAWQGSYIIHLPSLTGSYKLTYMKWNSGIGNWEKMAQDISVSSGTSQPLQIGDSGSILDEIRLYPTGAQMTTYTYDALVGINSVCDVNSMVQRYEYDSSNRLRLIKDNKGNIIKTFRYNYKK